VAIASNSLDLGGNVEQTKAVQVVERGGYLPMQQATPEQWAQRRQEFNGWVNTQLREGVDFGNIPTVDKPTLFKPGAEKIVQLFGCLPDTVVTHRESDMVTGYLYLEVTVELISLQTGLKVGAGIGSCSSYESKYRWRWEWWNSKGAPVGEGWETFRKRNGDTSYRRRIANPDLADVWNTVVKMAKKRALVDAALTISGASEKFTQDVEDMATDTEAATQPAPKAATQPTAATPATTEPPAQATEQSWTTDANTLKGFWANWKAKGLTEDEVHLNLNVTHLKDYTGTMSDAAKLLQAVADKKAAAKKA
jgi:hypothetical protein